MYVQGWGQKRYLDPCPGEQSTGGEDEDDVEDRVDGVTCDLSQAIRRRDIVSNSGDGAHLSAHGHLWLLPLSEHVDEHVLGVALVQDL